MLYFMLPHSEKVALVVSKWSHSPVLPLFMSLCYGWRQDFYCDNFVGTSLAEFQSGVTMPVTLLSCRYKRLIENYNSKNMTDWTWAKLQTKYSTFKRSPSKYFSSFTFWLTVCSNFPEQTPCPPTCLGSARSGRAAVSVCQHRLTFLPHEVSICCTWQAAGSV